MIPSPQATSTASVETPSSPEAPPTVPDAPLPTTAAPVRDLLVRTAFGVGCRVCLTPLQSHAMMRLHLRRKHQIGRPEKGGWPGLWKTVSEGSVLSLSESLLGGLSGPYHSAFQCKRCGLVAKDRRSFWNHLRPRKSSASPKCSLDDREVITAKASLCGRVVTEDEIKAVSKSCASTPPSVVGMSTITTSSSETISSTCTGPVVMVPGMLLKDRAPLDAFLERVVRKDEDTVAFRDYFLPLLRFGNIAEQVETFVARMQDSSDDPDLDFLLRVGKVWLKLDAAEHTMMLPVNIRNKISSFRAVEFDDRPGDSAGAFQVRQAPSKLVPELEKLLRFLWSDGGAYFKDLKCEVQDCRRRNDAVAHARRLGLIQRWLLHATIQEPGGFDESPALVYYMIARPFANQLGELQMLEAGTTARYLSCLLTVLRAGVCGTLVPLRGSNIVEEAQRQARRVQSARSVNHLAPFIRRCKEINKKKPSLKRSSVDASGNIFVDDLFFPQKIWSTLIPRMVSEFLRLFSLCFEKGDYCAVANCRLPIQINDWSLGDFIVARSQGQEILSSHLVVKTLSSSDEIFVRLVGMSELMFHGLGCGAIRDTEIFRMKCYAGTFHRGCLYYSSESLKMPGVKHSTDAKLSRHKLSPSLSRMYLLCRLVFIKAVPNLNYLIPAVEDCYNMCDVVQYLFGLPVRPTKVHIRHLWTDLHNILYPEKGVDDKLSASKKVAELSGHTVETHSRSYGTRYVGFEDNLFEDFHRALGEEYSESKYQQGGLSKKLLLSSLQHAVGDNFATYTSEKQEQLVDLASNSASRHAHIGLPCGGGKSMSWIVPTLARRISFQRSKTTVVVLPYVFLVTSIVEATKKALSQFRDLDVVSYSTREFGEELWPDGLARMDNLPSVVVVSLDAFCAMVEHGCHRLEAWARAGFLSSIILDELQQLYCEFTFREAYSKVKAMSGIGVPVITLSGSLADKLVPTVHDFLGLRCGGGQVNTIPLGDPVDTGYDMKVILQNNLPSAVHKMLTLYKDTKRSVAHVICSSRQLAGDVRKLLEGGLVQTDHLCFVTGDSTSKEQASCAKKWASGKARVLISTTSALVGNENAHCRTIIIVGVLFNLSCLLQAIGRLRPSQRDEYASVCVILPKAVTREVANQRYQMYMEEDHKRAQLFIDSGLLCNEQRTLYLQTFGQAELYRILLARKSCRLQMISKAFGYARGPCGRCDNCNQKCSKPSTPKKRARLETESPSEESPPSRQNKESQIVGCRLIEKANADRRAIDAHQTKLLINVLRKKCLSCNQPHCGGEECFSSKACFSCGSSLHLSARCPQRFKKIVGGGKACFFCWEHIAGYKKHGAMECRVKRRLKRLILLEVGQGKFGIERYLRATYQSYPSFKAQMAFLARKHGLLNEVNQEVLQLYGDQVGDDHPSSPLLPPTEICSRDINDGKIGRPFEFKDAPGAAREHYHRMGFSKQSRHTKRKYVWGATYRYLHPNHARILDVTKGGAFNVTIRTEEGITTTLRVRKCYSPEVIATAGVLARKLDGKQGNARTTTGDFGRMFALGKRDTKNNVDYKMTEKLPGELLSFTTNFRKWLRVALPEVLESIAKANGKNPYNVHKAIDKELGATLVCSENLRNSSHFDYSDGSLTVGVWVEENSGSATEWYFLLPNVSIDGSKGVAIKLGTGVVIEWNGKLLRHCTSLGRVGTSNNAFAFAAMSCR